MLASTEDYYRAQQALSVLGLRAARKAWSQLDYSDITGSWNDLSLALAVVLSATQLRAATDGATYVQDALAEQGVSAPIDGGSVVPSALSNIASNGKPLLSLLDEPRIQAFTARGNGASFADSLLAGRHSLDRIAVTQVQDAGRVAAGVSIAARPKVTGYVRMLNPPSCSRCVVLAGKHYRWNAGFRRHPRCDCRHVPVTDGDTDAPAPVSVEATDPDAYFKTLSAGEQDRIFTKAGAQAIRDGADISQVVNARQGMSTAAGYKTTTIGTTKYSLAGQRLREATGSRNVTRLMPESILQIAGKNRTEAIRLLHLHGYVL